MRNFKTAVIFTLLLALLTPLLTSTSVAGAASATAEIGTAEEADFVGRLNAIRSANGLGPLTIDSTMTGAARDWSFWMADNYTLQHAGDITVGAPWNWAKVGENVGRGGSVQAVMDAFMASPGHAANVLDPSYTLVGVGLVWNDDGKLYTTHRFASTSDPVPPPAPTPIPDPTPVPTAVPTTAPTAVPTPPAPPVVPVNDNQTPDTGFEDPTAVPVQPEPTETPAVEADEDQSQAPISLPFSEAGLNPAPDADPARLAITMAALLSA